MAKRPSPKSMPTGSEGAGAEKPAAAAAPGTPQMKTRTLPEAQRGAWYEGPDVVTGLRVYGTDVEFDLPRDKKTFTLGSSEERDLRLSESFLSALHCVLERRGDVLRVHDQNSYNGTYFDGRRESTFEIRPGGTFTVASLRLLAVNDAMKLAYPVLADILGTEGLPSTPNADTSASDVIVTATSGVNLLVLGESGGDQERLGRVIHAISLLRGRELTILAREPDDRRLQLALIDRASRSSMVIHVGAKTPVMDAAFASMIFSPSQHIRAIVLADSASRAESVLGAANVRTMRNIVIRPVALRGDSVPNLLDRMLIERGSDLRVSSLRVQNRAALRAYHWPNNFDDLRVAAERLIALAREGSLLRASKALGIGVSSLHYWVNQVGLSLPLLDGA